MSIKPIETDLSDDLLRGIEQIAPFIGLSIRRAYWAAERGHVPAFKHINRWCMRKSAYREMIARLEREATPS
jgi:hypothetical protein